MQPDPTESQTYFSELERITSRDIYQKILRYYQVNESNSHQEKTGERPNKNMSKW